MTRRCLPFLLAIPLLCSGGCSTVLSTVLKGPAPYRGTVWNVNGLSKSGRGATTVRIGSALDLPFSFCFDTLLLPVSSTYWVLAQLGWVEYSEAFIGGGG